MFKQLVTALVLSAFVVMPVSAERRLEVPNAIYGDCLPTGEHYAGRAGRAAVSHLGDISLPTGENFMMWNRITKAGGFKVASASNATGKVWVYANGAWTLDGRISHGTQGHAWRPDGSLAVLEPAGGQDSQGIRFWYPQAPANIANTDVLGRTAGFVTGSPSYGFGTELAKHFGVTRLFEWTYLDGIVVGQGDNGGAVIQRGNEHRILETGHTRFIQAHKTGADMCVAISAFDRNSVIFYWLTESEISRFPIYPVAGSGGPVDPPPPPPPAQRTMMMPADVHATFSAVVEKFPHVGDDDARRAAMRKAVETIRARHGERWATKTEHATGWESAAKDAIVFVPEGPMVEGAKTKLFIWDMIDGATRKPKAAHESEALREAFLLVPEAHDWLAGEEPPPPPPPTDDSEALKQRITELELQIRMLNETHDREWARIAELEIQNRDLTEKLNEALAEIDRLNHRSCVVAGGPGWIRSLFGIRCELR